MKRLLPWAIAGGALCTLFVYYAGAIVFDGAFVIPVRYGWNVPVPTGGTVVVRGVNDVGFGAEDARFEAIYRAAPSASTAPAPDEPIGTWYSETWNPVAYAVGAAIVFLPDASHAFVRTARGRWIPLPIESVAASPGTTGYAVRHVSPERRVVIVDRHGSGGALQARLFLQLSEDGERLTLTREQAARLP